VSSRFTQFVLVLCVLIPMGVVVLGGGYMAWQWWGKYACEAISLAPAPAGQVESSDVVLRVRELMVVPVDEPVVTSLQQVAALQQTNQRVYQDAQDGDQLLLFSDRAVIYSPAKDKIVNVVALNASSSTQMVAP
jgi:hypothetical protein